MARTAVTVEFCNPCAQCGGSLLPGSRAECAAAGAQLSAQDFAVMRRGNQKTSPVSAVTSYRP